MKHLKIWWLLLLGLLAVPYVLLLAAGTLWLYEHGMLWHWLVASGLITLVGWALVRWLRTKHVPPAAARVEPAGSWPPSGQQAWKQVEAIARRVQDEDLPLDRPEPLWQLLQEVLETVARQYHPKSPRAALEIPVPHMLRVIELVASDLRRAFSEHVPGSHILTLGDLGRLKRLATLIRPLYLLYRVASFGFNPTAALLREIRDLVGGRVMGTSTEEAKRWALGFCVRKAGFYAIQLYSGQLLLDDVDFDAYRTAHSKQDAARAEAQGERLKEEPLRILVLGQVKSGKSSLINALFGETRAAVDVVPRTRHVEPYVLERDGVPRAIILDTAGYDEADGTGNPFAELREHILQCDLLLVVCSAGSAARAADRRLLDELKAFFQQQPDRLMPPLVVAVTHVDQVRPLAEWDPPYDLVRPKGSKAEQIADALRAVQDDLAVGPDQPAVPVCLKPGQLYNVEEGLAPAILQSASEAQRVKYLRCLRQYHEEEYWKRLWQQGVNSGRILLKAGAAWVGRSATK